MSVGTNNLSNNNTEINGQETKTAYQTRCWIRQLQGGSYTTYHETGYPKNFIKKVQFNLNTIRHTLTSEGGLA